MNVNNVYNPFSLAGKRIMVTGASSGIGRAIAIECSRMGATVLLTARNEGRLKETLSQMEHQDRHKIVSADLLIADDLNVLIDAIDGKLDGLVCCAGIVDSKLFQFVDRESIFNVMNINFVAPLCLTNKIIKTKKINKDASIVYISSINGNLISSISTSIYAASKGALNGFIKSLALELAPKKIRVNSVSPGMIETDIFKNSAISENEKLEDIKKYPLKRYGEPSEVAYAVVYLLSDATKWMTGSSIVIDGGFTLQ